MYNEKKKAKQKDGNELHSVTYHLGIWRIWRIWGSGESKLKLLVFIRRYLYAGINTQVHTFAYVTGNES